MKNQIKKRLNFRSAFVLLVITIMVSVTSISAFATGSDPEAILENYNTITFSNLSSIAE